MSPLGQTAKEKLNIKKTGSLLKSSVARMLDCLFTSVVAFNELNGGGHPTFIIKASHIELFGLFGRRPGF